MTHPERLQLAIGLLQEVLEFPESVVPIAQYEEAIAEQHKLRAMIEDLNGQKLRLLRQLERREP